MKAGTQNLHTPLERRRRLAFVLFTVPFLLRAADFMVKGLPGYSDKVPILLGIVVPVILYFMGQRWCRYIVGILSLLGCFVCLIMPFSLHGRPTPSFWLLTVTFFLVFIFTAQTAFAREALTSVPERFP